MRLSRAKIQSILKKNGYFFGRYIASEYGSNAVKTVGYYIVDEYNDKIIYNNLSYKKLEQIVKKLS